jgi:hypothetical protein
MRTATLAFLTAFLGLLLIGADETPTKVEAPTITKEKLKPMLGSKDLVVIDVRLDEQWRFSNRKIPGAVHENPTVPSTWINKYSKDKTIVFY